MADPELIDNGNFNSATGLVVEFHKNPLPLGEKIQHLLKSGMTKEQIRSSFGVLVEDNGHDAG